MAIANIDIFKAGWLIKLEKVDEGLSCFLLRFIGIFTIYS